MLFVGIFVGLYSGVMTPTEAGAGSAALALAIALLRREMTWEVMQPSLIEICATTASLFFIVIGAAFFARFMAIPGCRTGLGRMMQNRDRRRSRSS